jgi:hypothetical protein
VAQLAQKGHLTAEEDGDLAQHAHVDLLEHL